MNGKTARLCRKIASTFTNKKAPEAFAKTWKRRWKKLNRRERTYARRSWAQQRAVRLPA